MPTNPPPPNPPPSPIARGSTQGHWRFPQHGLEPAYAYILTHPGTPSVFYDHLLDPHMKATLKTLIAIRKKAGVTCGSSLRIHTADNEKYAAEVEGVFSKIVVKIGFGHWSPNTVHGTNGAPASPINGESAPKKWIRVDSGHNWCVASMNDARLDLFLDPSLSSLHCAFVVGGVEGFERERKRVCCMPHLVDG